MDIDETNEMLPPGTIVHVISNAGTDRVATIIRIKKRWIRTGEDRTYRIVYVYRCQFQWGQMDVWPDEISKVDDESAVPIS